MTDVLAPLAGRVDRLDRAPDPVFAAEMVGSGVMITPEPGTHVVVAPVSGTVVKLHPHAFVLMTPSGTGVLVHLGIDTVRLGGEGFELHVAEGNPVRAADRVLTWDTSVAAGRGLSLAVPVVVMDSAPGSVAPRAGSTAATEVLFAV